MTSMCEQYAILYMHGNVLSLLSYSLQALRMEDRKLIDIYVQVE